MLQDVSTEAVTEADASDHTEKDQAANANQLEIGQTAEAARVEIDQGEAGDLAQPPGREELYRSQLISFSIVFFPEDNDPMGREVLVGIRNGADPPLFANCREGDFTPLPPVLTRLIQELRELLPLRAELRVKQPSTFVPPTVPPTPPEISLKRKGAVNKAEEFEDGARGGQNNQKPSLAEVKVKGVDNKTAVGVTPKVANGEDLPKTQDQPALPEKATTSPAASTSTPTPPTRQLSLFDV